MMLFLSIHEHGICFHLFVSSIFSSVSYNFPITGFLHPWLNLFQGVLFFFDVIMNEIIFLVSLSDSSLLVYISATELWILILYPATLLNLSVLIVFFGGIFRLLSI